MQIVTSLDGHTPLPSDTDNTLIVADYRLERHGSPWFRHGAVTTNFNLYNITAYGSDNIWTGIENTIYTNGTIQQLQPLAQVTGINPNASWYRTYPNIPANTINLQINYTKANMTVLPSVSPVNIIVNKWNASELLGMEAANFTANTANGNNVNFTINIKPYASYLIKKDNANYAIVQADLAGKITFSNSLW